jgi:hypothetical protein
MSTFLRKLDLCFRVVKIMDFAYIILLYFFLALFIAMGLDKIYGKFDSKEADKKSLLVNTVDFIVLLWINIVIIYIARNVISLVPSPLNGICKFEHSRVSELKSAYVFDILLIYFQKNLTDRMTYLYNRFT